MVQQSGSREERRRQLQGILNDPAQRPQLERMFWAITKGNPKIGQKLIETILDHEFLTHGKSRQPTLHLEAIEVPKEIPKDELVHIGDPKIRYRTMMEDVELLYENGRFVSCAWLVLSCLDALASPASSSDKGSFARFVAEKFPELDAELSSRQQNKTGGDLLYDRFRNGLAHAFAPKEGFALARDNELDGSYADEIRVDSGDSYIGINIDRLASDFISLVKGFES